MTVAAGYEPAVYAGDGVAVVFPFTWPLLSADHLIVEKTAGGTTTTLVRGIDYLLTWVAPGLAGSVRTIYMDGGTPVDDPPALGETITLHRVMPISQETDVRNRGPYLAEVIERALDRQAMISQQLSSGLDRHGDSHLPGGSRAIDWSRLLGRGALSERPDPGPDYAHAYFYATDTNVLYQCDGSDWLPLQFGSGGLPPGDLYVLRSWLITNVRTYGALGNGTNDDRVAIVAAIAAAPAGTAVYFPPGTYRIGAQISITKSLWLIGDSADTCIIKGDQGIALGQGALIQMTGFPCGMSDMQIDGQTPTNGYHLLSFSTGMIYNVNVDRCIFRNMKTRAALRAAWNNTTGANRGNVRVRNCKFYNGTSAGAIAFYTNEAGKGVTGIQVIDCDMVDVGGPTCAISNTDTGIAAKYDGFIGMRFTGNYIVANDTGPFGPIPTEFWGHTDAQINNNIVPSGTRGIGLSAGKNCTFNGNIISNQTLYASEAAGNDNCVYSNNIIKNCRSFIEDTTASWDIPSNRLTIQNNSVTGSGLAAYDATARCIKANSFAAATGWKILNNSFKDYINGAKVISLDGDTGSGDHIVEGNTYEVTDSSATMTFYDARGAREIVRRNTVKITADITAATPAAQCFSYQPSTASDCQILDNVVLFSGAIVAGGIYAFGVSASPAATPGMVYAGNRAVGTFSNTFNFPNTDGTAQAVGNDFSQANGTISVNAAVLRRDLINRYSGTAAPTTGTWVRGEVIENENPSAGGPWGWRCVVSGTPGTWETLWFNNVDGSAGTYREFIARTDGVKRAGFGLYTDAESGSDAGSRLGAWSYDDAGNLIGFAWWASRVRTGGTFEISRPTIWLGSTSALTNTDVRINPRTGYAGMLSFYENQVRRWVETSAATTGNRDLKAYNSSGVLLDTVWSLANAAGGEWAINRPTKFTGNIGFFNTTPIAKPTVSGSRGGNAALASLLTQLAALGLITDSTT